MGGGYSIKMQFDIKVEPTEVRRWLDNPEGIAGWWSDSVEGSATQVGDGFEVRFPTTDVVFELQVADASSQQISWHIAENPPWWRDTTISFHLADGEASPTRLLFTHAGFDPEDPIIPVITPAWAQFLFNLKQVAESGQPQPVVVN